MDSLLMTLLAAAAVSAVVSALVSLWLRPRARGGSARDIPPHAHPRRPRDGALEDEWIGLHERMLVAGRHIVTGVYEEVNARLARVEERPAARPDAPRPRPAQPPIAAPAAPPRERDDASRALARGLYHDWCAQGRRPEQSDEMRIVPLRHEVLPADGATGQPRSRFHDAQQVDAFVRFSTREDTGWMFPHPDARHVPDYLRLIFPALSADQLTSRASLAATEPVAIVRRRDCWELR